MKITVTFLSAVLITLFSFSAKAQDDVQYAKSYMSVMGGISSPSGNFKQTNYYNNNAGFAKNGTTFGIEGAYYIYKNLGIGINFSFQDQGELTNNDALTLAAGYNADYIKDNTTVTSVNRYHNLTLMAGPQYSFLYKKFTLDLRAEAGYFKNTSSPDISVVFDYSDNTAQTITQNSSTAKAFGYGGLAGLRYSFSDSWDVGIRGTYLKTDGINIGNSGPYTTTGRLVTKQPMEVIQTTASITLRF
jgi:opacity protein-like surface antigen